VPFIVLLAYLVVLWIAGSSILPFFKSGQDSWQFIITTTLTRCVSAIIIIIVVIFLVSRSFPRGLKGFGLNPRSILRDLPAAFLNYWAVLPLVLFTIITTAYIGKIFVRPDFKIEQHQELKIIAKFDNNLAVLISVLIIVVVIGPLVEEFLFRGLLQTTIRSFGHSPWVAITVTSVLFAFVHADLSHQPAIFILSCGIGYSFEKSGSLLRSIFFHAIFNASSVIAVLITYYLSS
jgi:hypothetical protein